MFKRFAKLNKDELSDLLGFIGEDPKTIFRDIQNPRRQGSGFSSTVTGGKYRVTGTPQSTEYDIRVLYDI